ncbi:MAG: response regulator [Lachnospiraceae bacterium]|nr:response regulator [Lachnospiraceae bacterium]
MVKLFLAEDEIAMREGIKRHIDWEEEGVEFCGEAGDGELAWPMILELRPDIVVTDIRMPFMDGLELTALIRKELPDTRVIILSGYGEFSYAQEALRLGVSEYLLKPVTPRRLREVIREQARSVEEEKKRRRERISSLLKERDRDGIDMNQVIAGANLRGPLDSFLRTGTLGESARFMEDMFSGLGEENVKSIIFLNYVVMDSYISMVNFIKDLGNDPDGIITAAGDINTAIASLRSAEDAREFLTACLAETLRQRDEAASGKNNQQLQSALKFIDSHFTEGSVSLQSVADEVGMSPNRFSAMFSREMGMTFIDYLIGKRMERACELLMTTDLRSSEVAYKSGYNDPHYFSATFKKINGMSPREYRMRGQLKHDEEEKR